MYYFASDIHLGAGSDSESRATERLFVEWLERVAKDATAIILCGDIFDFWYEYKNVVPKGFTRTLGTISRITDSGVRVIFMAGNHDMWIKDYFATECGMEIYTRPTTLTLANKEVHIAHGDNLNIKGNATLKLMNGFFRSNFIRWCFSHLVHPDLGLSFGKWWSGSSRKGHKSESDEDRYDTHQHFLLEYANRHYAEHHCDLYIFGHLHLVDNRQKEAPSTIFMNDWSTDPHYIALDESGRAELKRVKIEQ